MTSTCSQGQRRKIVHQRRRRRSARSCPARGAGVSPPDARSWLGRIGTAQLHAQRLSDHCRHLVRLADGGQADEEDAVLELLQHVLGHGQRQPRLADAGRTDRVTRRAVVEETPAHGGDVGERPMSGVSWAGRLLGRCGRSSRALAVKSAPVPCQGDQAWQVGIVHAERLRQCAATSDADGCRSPLSILRTVTSAQPAP
ncbi:MAG: hypothetical protein R2844_16325 [Caldilineales bacterium]